MSQKQHANFVTSSLCSAGYAPGPHFDQLISDAVSFQRRRISGQHLVYSFSKLDQDKNRIRRYLTDRLFHQFADLQELVECVVNTVECKEEVVEAFFQGEKPEFFFKEGRLWCKNYGDFEWFLYRSLMRGSVLRLHFGETCLRKYISDAVGPLRSKRYHKHRLWQAKKIVDLSGHDYHAPFTVDRDGRLVCRWEQRYVAT